MEPSPRARGWKIQSAEFVGGAFHYDQLPPPFLPEVAFAGKSNVGKSSLMNALMNRRGLVKTSSVPGKTRQIAFFRVNDRLLLVDLPGYGFSRAPKQQQSGWDSLIGAYLAERPTLRGVVLIVDSRHAPTPLDLRMRSLLEEVSLPALVVANKVDKLKSGQLRIQLETIRRALGLASAPLACSARDRSGIPELWQALGVWIADPAVRKRRP